MVDENTRSGLIRPYSATLVELNRAVDGLWVIACLWLVTTWFGQPWTYLCTILSLFAVLVFAIAASFNHLYRSWRIAPLHEEASRIWLSWCVTVLFTAFAAYSFEFADAFPRAVMWWWFAVTPVLLAGTRVIVRVVLRSIRMRGYNFRTTAIVGATRIGQQIAKNINDTSWMGLRIVGFFDDRNAKDLRGQVAAIAGEIKGNLDELVRRAEAGDIDTIYITLPLSAERRVKDIIDRLAYTPASVYYVPDFFVFNLLHAQWEHVGDLPAVRVVTTPFLGISGWTKRAEDLVLSVLILSVIALPMLAIALAIRLTSSGPAIFRQRRYGLNGKEFKIWKFRTMTVCEDGSAFVQAGRNDSRVTPIGRFLRRTSLDELPQFINVLQGSMSIVGPRPHPVALDDQHRSLIPRYMLRQRIRPGITGWAQVNGFRGETDTIDKMRMRIRYDIEYIDRWSLLLDFKIIAMTLLGGFVSENAF